jgi:PKD repeat protein
MDPRRVRAKRITRAAVFAALVCGVCSVPPALAAQQPSTATGYAQVRHVCSPPARGEASCLALLRAPIRSTAAATTAGARPYSLNDGAGSSGPAGGLTPEQLASAYEYDPNAGGTGQTVAIADAYDDPKIEEDLGAFDSNYSLAPCTEANGCFEKVGQSGSSSALPEADRSGWSVETSLDVEAVHAACPKCKILLVEAETPSYSNLADAVNEAVALGATEVSNSYGGPEAAIGAIEQAAYNHPGVMIAAATGDDGYDDWDEIDELVFYEGELYFGFSPEMPNAPASLASVVSVGGTTLNLNSEGKRASETVWNNNGPGDRVGLENGYAQGASGGGCSTRFTAPRWQQSVSGFAATGCGTKRLAADISAVANPLTGFDIYDSYNCGSYCEEVGLGKGWLTIGGTSLSTPLVSALYGLAGGSDGVQYPALTLYGHRAEASSLYDVTKGANGFCDGESVTECGDPNSSFGVVDCEGTTACNATTGFDGPSGVGTPEGLGAFELLRPSAVITAPSTLKVGLAASFSSAGSSDPFPGGSISSYSWDWGDGTPHSVGAAPTHTFAAPGEYEVSLTVTDSYGVTSTLSTQKVSVHETTPREIEEEEAARAREEEAAAKERQEEEAATRKKQQEEAAAKKAHEEEVAAAAKRQEEQAAIGKPALGTAAFQAHGSAALPTARLASTNLIVSAAGSVSLKISCPAGESECVGSVSLRTLSAVSAAGAKHKSILTLAQASFTVPGGGLMTVTLHLSRKARILLARSHQLSARVSLAAHDPAGAVSSTLETVHLRLARRGHG